MFRVGLLLAIHSVYCLHLVSLNDLWATKYLLGHHLFPTHDSLLYPHFLAFPVAGSATIHMTYTSVLQMSQSRLIHSVCSYKYVNTTYFVANEEFGPGLTELALDLTLNELQNKANVMTFKLMKPSYFCFDPYRKTFNAVWQRPITPLKHFEISMQPMNNVITTDHKLGMAGYYPDCWQVMEMNDTLVALAIWRKGYGVRYRVQSGTSLKEVIAQMNGTDMHPVTLSVVPNKHKGKETVWWILWQGSEFTWRGRQIQKSQMELEEWLEIETAIVEQMRQYDIPSISICVMNDSKVLYEAAFGYGDIRQLKQATSNSEYRIASISKTITSMGIAQLINKGLLSLDNNVFGDDGILQQYSVHDSLKFIKIRHLLEHASGGWSHFQRHEFNRNESDHITLVKKLVTGYTLTKRPGENFTYSNIGYILLGRVIEQISGTHYEQFIRDKLFRPLGISARVGDLYPGVHEVSYYSQDNASPYNHWNPRLLDAATGWVFNARDLAKVFDALEKGRGTEFSIVATRSNATKIYGRGIQIGEDGSLYHTGSLAGSEAFAVTRGAQVVILTNLRGRQHNVHTGWMSTFSRKILDKLI